MTPLSRMRSQARKSLPLPLDESSHNKSTGAESLPLFVLLESRIYFNDPDAVEEAPGE